MQIKQRNTQDQLAWLGSSASIQKINTNLSKLFKKIEKYEVLLNSFYESALP